MLTDQRIDALVSSVQSERAGVERSETLGLVHSGTSHTPPGWIEVDQHKTRTRKCRHSTITAARLMDSQLRQGGRRTFPVMITLTYALADSWRSKHVSAFLTTCRNWFRRRGLRFHYVWVAELQKRGAVHYHVVVWMPKGFTLPKPDKRGWWVHGTTKIERARNPVGYLAKYVSKEALDHRFPSGCRIYGNGGLESTQRIELRWWLSPAWVRQQTTDITDVRRAPGGGFVRVDTGELLVSPWLVLLLRGAIYIRKKSEIGLGTPLPTPL